MNYPLDARQVPATHSRCDDCEIRTRAVCAYCGPTELAVLDAIKSYRTFGPGDEITAMGEESDFLGSVVTGVVSLSQGMEDGRRQMVGLLFPGDFIGRPLRKVAPFDAVAVTDVRLCIFMRSRFESLLLHTPDLERRLLEMTLDELDVAREWMMLLGRKTARERIASFVSLCARRASALKLAEPQDGTTLDLPLTREQMADFLGLTIETVSRQIGALKKDGVIELADARTLRLPRIDRLRAAAGEVA